MSSRFGRREFLKKSVGTAALAAGASVVGVPAKPVGRGHTGLPGGTMDQTLDEPDYVI